MHVSGSRFLALSILALAATFASAQTYIYDPGRPPYTTIIPVELGFINAANGNLHLEVPLGSSLPQRGVPPFTAVMMYDSRIWVPVQGKWSPTNVPDVAKSPGGASGLASSQGGWRVVTSADVGVGTYFADTTTQVIRRPILVILRGIHPTGLGTTSRILEKPILEPSSRSALRNLT